METHLTPASEPVVVPVPALAEYIVSTPGTCGGKPRIAGHRIRVQDVAIWHEKLGYSVEEILAHYPQLTLAKVHAALAYYYEHRALIQQDIADDAAFVEAFKREHPEKVFTLPHHAIADSPPSG